MSNMQPLISLEESELEESQNNEKLPVLIANAMFEIPKEKTQEQEEQEPIITTNRIDVPMKRGDDNLPELQSDAIPSQNQMELIDPLKLCPEPDKAQEPEIHRDSYGYEYRMVQSRNRATEVVWPGREFLLRCNTGALCSGLAILKFGIVTISIGHNHLPGEEIKDEPLLSLDSLEAPTSSEYVPSQYFKRPSFSNTETESGMAPPTKRMARKDDPIP